MFIALHIATSLSHNEATAWPEELNSWHLEWITWLSQIRVYTLWLSAGDVNEAFFETKIRPRRLKFCSRRDRDNQNQVSRPSWDQDFIPGTYLRSLKNPTQLV